VTEFSAAVFCQMLVGFKL